MTTDNKMLEEKLAEQGRQMSKDFMSQTIAILDRMKTRFGPDVYSVVEEVMAERARSRWFEIARR